MKLTSFAPLVLHTYMGAYIHSLLMHLPTNNKHIFSKTIRLPGQLSRYIDKPRESEKCVRFYIHVRSRRKIGFHVRCVLEFSNEREKRKK